MIIRNSLNYYSDVVINNVSQTGVKEKCVWNDLNSFKVTDNNCVDIMHDMLEVYASMILG